MANQVTEKLTRENLSDLLHISESASHDDQYPPIEQRRWPHWLEDSVIEFWPADENWQEPWRGKCRNISHGGLGMNCNHYLEDGTNIGIALYFRDKCFHGKAVIRYCKKVRDQFMIGVEFLFDD